MSLPVDIEQKLYEAVTALIHGGPLPKGFEQVPSSALAKVGHMTVAGEKFFLKVYLPGSRLDRIKESIRGSRAERARQAAHELERTNFATAEVVMTGKLADCSWMVSRAIDGVGLGFYAYGFLRPPFSPARLRWKRQVILSLGHFIGRLHAEGIIHGDLRLNNILIDGKAPTPSFALIDNERNQRFRVYLPQRLRIKNLVQATLFHPPIVRRTDRLRFYEAYCEEIGLVSERKRRALARAIERKYRERYARLVQIQQPVCWDQPENVFNVPA